MPVYKPSGTICKISVLEQLVACSQLCHLFLIVTLHWVYLLNKNVNFLLLDEAKSVSPTIATSYPWYCIPDIKLL